MCSAYWRSSSSWITYFSPVRSNLKSIPWRSISSRCSSGYSALDCRARSKNAGGRMRRARVHRHRRALGLAPVAGGHHAEEDHPAAQSHRFADGPEAAGRGAGGVARSLVVDHGDAQVAAPGQLVGAGRADHAAAGNHDVIGSVHVQASVPRFWNAENGIGSIGKRGRSQPTSWRPVARRRRSLQ